MFYVRLKAPFYLEIVNIFERSMYLVLKIESIRYIEFESTVADDLSFGFIIEWVGFTIYLSHITKQEEITRIGFISNKLRTRAIK